MPIIIFLSKYRLILRMKSISYINDINTIGKLIFHYSCFNNFDLALFGSHFCYLFLPWDRITMVFHGVNFLSVVLKLDCLATLGLASGAGFCRFKGPLCRVIFRLYFQYFTHIIGKHTLADFHATG